jgi:3-hydroxyisobutyrate dehydrogenase-like beta-hydroxyacid dehydrogenase
LNSFRDSVAKIALSATGPDGLAHHGLAQPPRTGFLQLNQERAMSVGFIGLGNIGKPMALHWAHGEQPLLVFDVVPQAASDLVAAGAKAAASVIELAHQSNIIGICVRDDKQVEQLLYGADGILENARPDTVVAIHSTVYQESILAWHEAGKAKSIHVIDASVTRSLEPGNFCYMIGGTATLVERCRPLLAAGGNKVVHAGPVGAGIALKLCNNMMTYAAFIAMHEACDLAEAFGLDARLLQEVGDANGVVTPLMAAFWNQRKQLADQGEEVLRGAFGPHAANASKDLSAALKSAQELEVSLPGARKSLELIQDVFVNG